MHDDGSGEGARRTERRHGPDEAHRARRPRRRRRDQRPSRRRHSPAPAVPRVAGTDRRARAPAPEPDHPPALLAGHMELRLDQRIPALGRDGTELRAAVFNENEVRAAAGLTLVIGAVAFAYAYFGKNYMPLQVVTIVFFSEFLARLTIGLRYSPMGVIA